jgi:hypothetical protein
LDYCRMHVVKKLTGIKRSPLGFFSKNIKGKDNIALSLLASTNV